MLSGAAYPVAEVNEEELDIRCWRYEQFVELGFSAAEAYKLADSDADLGHARSLRRSGCGAELALRILL